MGTYTVADFMTTFGGLPERGEAAIDVRDLADRQRDEADEYTASDITADAVMDELHREDHEHDDLDLLRDEHEPFEEADDDHC